MKHKKFLLAVLISGISFLSMYAQEEESASKFNVGADVYSNYIWRGSKFGTGPSFQPSVSFSSGMVTVGVWGAFDAAGYTEADPYVSLSLPFGLSLGVTDYYYPTHMDSTGSFVPSSFFKTDKASSFHAFEINVGFSKGGFSLSANYIINEAAGAASMGGDKYFQVGYSFKNVDLFVGAGDGWHTKDTEFAVCNIGIGTSKTIKITDTFSVPVKGQVVVNPDKEQMMLVVGFSL